MDSHNTDRLITWTNFFGPVIRPWFYTEMPMDNTDSVSMDFLITQTPFLAR